MTHDHRLTIAITGGRGFIGRAVAKTAAQRGHRVVSLDISPANDAGEYVVDVRDGIELRRIFACERPDVVVHAAAVAGVANVASDVPGATSINVIGGVNVMEAAVRSGVPKLVELSSEEIYGRPLDQPVREDAPLRPENEYGIHKFATEKLGERYAARGLEYIAARLTWVYGPGFPRDRPPQRWVDDAISGRPTTVAHGKDHVVDLVYVDDAARAVVALAETENLRHNVFNIGSGEPITLGGVAAVIAAVFPPWTNDLGPGELEGITSRGAISVDRIEEATSWRATTSLIDGLKATAESLKRQTMKDIIDHG